MAMASEQKKQNIGVLYKLGAFLAFLMLGYLGIRGYKDSVERLKIKGCSDEIRELMMNIKERYATAHDYGKLDFKQVLTMRLFPKSMNKPGYSEPLNSYTGGVDIYYSALSPDALHGAFEISFQGLSKDGCIALMRLTLDDGTGRDYIAVGGYGVATPAGVLDEVYHDTPKEKMKRNVFKSTEVLYTDVNLLKNACSCKDLTCSVVWKFR